MFSKQDISNAQNLMKLLAKAKMELEGLEVLAAAEAMKWFSGFVKFMETEAAKPPPPPPPQVQVLPVAPVAQPDKIEEVKKPSRKK